MSHILSRDVIKLSRRILEKYDLCDWCLGRQFPYQLAAVSFRERGAALRKMVLAKEPLRDFSRIEGCYICRFLMSSLDGLSRKAVEMLGEYEFDSFIVGTTLLPEFSEREDRLRAEYKLRGGETIKGGVRREVGRIISIEMGKKVSYKDQDLVVLVEPLTGMVKVIPKPIFLFGRYLKRVRGIPQRAGRCDECKGLGCAKCNYTGLKESIGSILSRKLLDHFKGSKVRFTWIGSEDRDSLVMGNGRPFYAEVLEPKVRSIDDPWAFVGQEGEPVALSEVKLVQNKPKAKVEFTLEVSAHVKLGREVSDRELKEVEEAFKDTVVQAVSKRKKMLSKRVYSLAFVRASGTEADLRIKCDGGLSIKGLVMGEGGSVVPNVEEKLSCKVLLKDEMPFDVLNVDVSSNSP